MPKTHLRRYELAGVPKLTLCGRPYDPGVAVIGRNQVVDAATCKACQRADDALTGYAARALVSEALPFDDDECWNALPLPNQPKNKKTPTAPNLGPEFTMTALEIVQRAAPKNVRLLHKAPCGVISFLNRTAPTLEHPNGAKQEIRVEHFTLRGRRYMLASFDGETDWEVYRIDFDNSKLFEGYASDVLASIIRGQPPK